MLFSPLLVHSWHEEKWKTPVNNATQCSSHPRVYSSLTLPPHFISSPSVITTGRRTWSRLFSSPLPPLHWNWDSERHVEIAKRSVWEGRNSPWKPNYTWSTWVTRIAVTWTFTTTKKIIAATKKYDDDDSVAPHNSVDFLHRKKNLFSNTIHNCITREEKACNETISTYFFLSPV